MTLNIHLLQPHSRKCCIQQIKDYFTPRFNHPSPSSLLFIYITTILLQAVAWLVQFFRVTSSY